MLKEFAEIFPVLLVGMAIGCMLMAILHRLAPRLRSKLRLNDSNAAPEKFPPAKVVPINRREVRR
ncbi:MAG TPA: hypothetical protein VHW72_03275 [Candidatus Angelobacter sp.]|jgi:hypothetical protein|nr:hypothetical protein [Candidatus Angelobacter sp.]